MSFSSSQLYHIDDNAQPVNVYLAHQPLAPQFCSRKVQDLKSPRYHACGVPCRPAVRICDKGEEDFNFFSHCQRMAVSIKINPLCQANFLNRCDMRLVCISLSVVVLFALLSRVLLASEAVRPVEPAGPDVAFLLNLARSGNVEAQVLLGEYYLDRQEYAEALPWLQLAAGQGEVGAQRRLAVMYETGQGVQRDYEQAAFWLRCATEQRDPFAFYKEGFCYTTSAGVP
jgi:hypothetical protein